MTTDSDDVGVIGCGLSGVRCGVCVEDEVQVNG